jgi:hypothetical protein
MDYIYFNRSISTSVSIHNMARVIDIRTKDGLSLSDAVQGGPMLTPIREITASNFGVKTTFASQKNLAPRQAESLLEHDFLTLLEWDPRVARYGTQPLSVNWRDNEGKVRQYTPDVLVTYHSLALMDDPALRATVFEVKPWEVLRRDWPLLRPKFKAAIEALRPVGVRFKIVTERHIRTPLLDNARRLLAYKTTRFANPTTREQEMQTEIRKALLMLGRTTPKQLLASLTDRDEQKVQYIPWIWWLMNVGIVKADLNKPLTMASDIWSIDTSKSIPAS